MEGAAGGDEIADRVKRVGDRGVSDGGVDDRVLQPVG
jgi:hypothetical protein